MRANSNIGYDTWETQARNMKKLNRNLNGEIVASGGAWKLWVKVYLNQIIIAI